jgi:hypothetical protein
MARIIVKAFFLIFLTLVYAVCWRGVFFLVNQPSDVAIAAGVFGLFGSSTLYLYSIARVIFWRTYQYGTKP